MWERFRKNFEIATHLGQNKYQGRLSKSFFIGLYQKICFDTLLQFVPILRACHLCELFTLFQLSKYGCEEEIAKLETNISEFICALPTYMNFISRTLKEFE